MAVVKLYAEARKPRKDGTTKVYLQVVHDRVKKTIPLNLYVQVSHFDFIQMKCSKSHPSSAKVNFKLVEFLAKAQEVLIEISNKRLGLEEICLRIEAAIFSGPNADLIKPFVEKLMEEQIKTGRNGNATSYQNALNQFESWLNQPAKWSDLTYEKLNNFKVSKIANGAKPNTVAAYLRAIRVWANEAIRRGIFPKDEYPFLRGLMPSKQRTKRRNVKGEVISKIWQNRESFTGLQRIAINTILMQFLLQGADFIEVARLKKSNIMDGYVTFSRYKNRGKGNDQEIKVKVLPEIELIINESYNDFLVPVVCLDDVEKNYKNLNTKRRKFRRVLTESLEKLGITELTSKGIRHTWATIAASLGVSEEIRELAMGHSSGGMQEIYTELDQKEVDLANFKVISFLLRGQADLLSHTWQERILSIK